MFFHSNNDRRDKTDINKSRKLATSWIWFTFTSPREETLAQKHGIMSDLALKLLVLDEFVESKKLSYRLIYFYFYF